MFVAPQLCFWAHGGSLACRGPSSTCTLAKASGLSEFYVIKNAKPQKGGGSDGHAQRLRVSLGNFIGTSPLPAPRTALSNACVHANCDVVATDPLQPRFTDEEGLPSPPIEQSLYPATVQLLIITHSTTVTSYFHPWGRGKREFRAWGFKSLRSRDFSGPTGVSASLVAQC